MQKFLFKIALFSLPLIVLLATTEYQLSLIPNDVNVRRAFLEKRLAQWQILILGSSHARSAVNPRLIGDDTFNLACSSQDHFYDSRILLKYISQMPSLKLVVIPISYFSLEYRLNEAHESWRCGLYHHIYSLPDEEGHWFNSRDYSYISLYGVPDTKSYIRRGFKVNLSGEVDKQGWQADAPILPQVEDLISDGKLRIDQHHKEMRPQNQLWNIKLLEEMLRELKARNVTAVLITTPCFYSYSHNTNPQTYKRMQDSIQRLCAHHRLEYYNYFTDSRFESKDFRDSDHLNALGAEKFSHIIREDFVRKYVSDSPSSQ